MLRIDDLHVHYGNVYALKGVSIEIHEGELVMLIGANGAGKTTLLMTVSGILKPTWGTIDFLGTRIEKLSAHAIVRKGLAQVAQGRQLFLEMTVLENLELGAYTDKGRSRKSMQQKLDDIFSNFEILRKQINQPAGTLSGGQQQMLAIARALMSSPQLLLLDEPSTGLAPLVVETLAQIVSDLCRKGLPILLVEQDAYFALEIANRGYVLETGKVVASGTPSELSENHLVKEAYLGIST